jgi:hypothetical protein
MKERMCNSSKKNAENNNGTYERREIRWMHWEKPENWI